MKQKTITKDNYLKFKPSEFVRSFLSDVEVAIEKNMPMNMGNWTSGKGVDWEKPDAPDVNCMPCLGGMACMNMRIGRSRSIFNYNLGDRVSELGDYIRRGIGGEVKNALLKLYPDITAIKKIKMGQRQHYVDGIVYPDNGKLKKLKSNINYYADKLEKAGY